MIRGADLGLYLFVSGIGRTIRFEPVSGWQAGEREGWRDYKEAYARMPNTINAFWHNRLFLMTWFWRGFDSAVLVSESFDGEYIARTAQRFGFPVIRGSSTRGGSKALRQMARVMRSGTRMSITIDGPKGPRCQVKPGVVMLAASTGVPIVPMLPQAKHYWEMNSWDRLQIPKPFTTAKVFVGEPVFVSREDIKGGIEPKVEELQKRFEGLQTCADEWRRAE